VRQDVFDYIETPDKYKHKHGRTRMLSGLKTINPT
jgi:hypothetical protein